jgi:hypothetical protein
MERTNGIWKRVDRRFVGWIHLVRILHRPLARSIAGFLSKLVISAPQIWSDIAESIAGKRGLEHFLEVTAMIPRQAQAARAEHCSMFSSTSYYCHTIPVFVRLRSYKLLL